MKKFASLFTALCIALSMLGTLTASAENETAADLEISTLAELEAFRDDVNNGNTYEGKTVKLTADIDMSEKYGEGREIWTPIGVDFYSDSKYFQGIFDGDSHTINGLYSYTEEEDGFASFFTAVADTVKNLNIKGTVIANNPSWMNSAAGIVLCLNQNAQMINCSFEGLVKNSDYVAGGLVESNRGLISNCRFKGKIEGQHLVGGIASTGDGTITNCVNEGEIIGTSPVGGITGWGQTIKNCINKGSVTGRTYINSYTDIDGAEVTESITSLFVGGISGITDNTFCIENCYNTGAVSGNNKVGGIIGAANIPWENEVLFKVKNCYNIGNITSTMEKNDGEHNIGAIIGSREFNDIDSDNNVTKVLTSEAVDCYYLAGTADKGCGGNAEDTATALTTAQFADSANFANWDFETIWEMDTTLKKPVLQSNTEEPPAEIRYNIEYTDGNAVATVPQSGTYTIIFASYAEDALLSVEILERQLEKGENPPVTPLNFTADGNIRVMLWEGLKNIRPLCACASDGQ